MTPVEPIEVLDLELVEIPVGLIVPDPQNPRSKMDAGRLKELARSIAQQGLLQPVTVQPSNGDGLHMLAFGHRRFAAIELINEAPGDYGFDPDAGIPLPTVLGFVQKGASAGDVALQQLVENLQREDIAPIDEARALMRLCGEEFGLKQKDVAAKIGRSAAHVSKRLRLLSLPPAIAAKVGGDKLPIEVAVKVAEAYELDGAAAARNIDMTGWAEDIKAEAEQVIREAKGDIDEARMRAELEGKGRIVVSGSGTGTMWANEVGHLGLDPDVHESEPCARFVIARYYGEPRLSQYCISPISHLDDDALPKPKRRADKEALAKASAAGDKDAAGASKVTDPEAVARLKRHVSSQVTTPTTAAATSNKMADAEKAERANEREIAKHRKAWLNERFRATKLTTAKDLAVEHVLKDVGSDAGRKACIALGLEPIVSPPAYAGGQKTRDYITPLRELAASGPKGLATVVTAIVFFEHNAWSKEGGYRYNEGSTFYEWAAKLGEYPPHELEAAEIKARTDLAEIVAAGVAAGQTFIDEADDIDAEMAEQLKTRLAGSFEHRVFHQGVTKAELVQKAKSQAGEYLAAVRKVMAEHEAEPADPADESVDLDEAIDEADQRGDDDPDVEDVLG